jgi:Xaa-Pro aminopeptidase
MNEFEQKKTAVNALLERHGLDALLLRRASSFAWATAGAASYVNTAASEGVASLLITPAGRYLITDNIEAPRLEKEEQLKEQGWEFHIHPWYETADAIERLTRGLLVGADVPFPGAADLSGPLARLRADLTHEEGERFRELGRLCAEAMDRAIRAVRPGMSEHQIAAPLFTETESRGVQTIVNLIATDERIFNFRHPLPTHKTLDRYAMLVLCGRQKGLVCSMTRLISFGRLPDDVRRKAEAVAQVDAAFILGTRPGRALGDIFQEALDAYAQTGFPDEWQLHHQGGPAGYEPREYIAVPGSSDVVRVGQAYAWNPSITGAKSEDTILVGETDNEVLTQIEGWPDLQVVVGGKELPRPAILEVT